MVVAAPPQALLDNGLGLGAEQPPYDRNYTRRAVQRLRFVKLATASGWLWLVELSNHVGAFLLLLAAVGVSAFSAVKLPDWWWGAPIFFGFYVLLFGEGAFRLWRARRAMPPIGEGLSAPRGNFGLSCWIFKRRSH
jgi:hypothetical protein